MDRKNERAFTLLELLLVILIIGVLAAVVVQRFVGVGEEAKTAAARAQINAFEGALERYKLHMDKFPTTEEGLQVLTRAPDDEEEAENWKGPYLAKTAIPKDPWKHDYIYKCPGEVNETSYDIICLGPDGEEGTDDDINSWGEEEEE